MRKMITQVMLSIDGYFEGPHREIGWHNVDDEYNEYAAGLLDSAGAIIFGRHTYELMSNYWPTKTAIENDPVIANRMNQLPKIVFSKSLKKIEWDHTRLLKEADKEEIIRLKEQSAMDLVVLGSANLVSYLSNLGVIDEYQVMINPLVLGKGRPYFQEPQKLILNRQKTKVFRSGNVLLCYHPIR